MRIEDLSRKKSVWGRQKIFREIELTCQKDCCADQAVHQCLKLKVSNVQKFRETNFTWKLFDTNAHQIQAKMIWLWPLAFIET